MTIHPKIKEGKLELTMPHQQFLLKHEGKFANVSIPKPKRSGQQNKLYWLFLKVIENETGNLASDLHEFLKLKLLPKKFIVITGKENAHEVQIPVSTTDLSKSEFAEYIMKIEALVGIPCPDPHELDGYVCSNKSCPNCS